MVTATAPISPGISPWKAPVNTNSGGGKLDVFTRSSQDWVPPKRPNFARQQSEALGQEPSQLTLTNGQTLALGEFAEKRHRPGTGCAYFTGSKQELLQLVEKGWDGRQPGTGRTNLEEVVTVSVPADKFMTTVVPVDQDTELSAGFARRRSHEEGYIRVSAKGEAQPAQFAKVVLYSADTLGKNNERSIDTDWEIVSLIASPVENEPMDPVTMMRNMRGKPGGTPVEYSADQLLDAIEFWSKHTKLSPGS
jgi:hypothetical protein